MTTSRTYDGFNRLTGIASAPSGASAVSFQYVYNQANQRVAVTNADNSRWDFGYDSLGQVISGKKYWADGTPVAGQQFEYQFDTIGNRRTYKWGGDANGANLRQTSYTVNLLNQITGRNNPGYVTITGEADTNAAVKVNGTATSRHGRYFAGEAPVNNAYPVWLGITNVAVAATNGGPETYTAEVGHVFVPRASQTLSTIYEGCLYADGRWSYRWDAENRLVKMTAASAYVGYPYQELRFTHDWQSRRISKVVSNKVSGVWYLETSRKFLYDGWNLVAELDASNVLQRSHVWGTDASGTMQGAGGVGGLLATIIPEGLPNAGVYFPAYDGNHNVVAYISAATGAIVAEYDYGPFGELLRATGPMAKDFNFLFSTKYHDWETGLYYYGYRYYNPNTGRWLSRDPIEEQGGANLYGFVGNEPMKHYDVLGLLPPIDGIPNGRSDLPYDQFEKYLEDYVLGRRLLQGEKSQIERGCVGQCSVIQRVSIGAKYIQVWPENAKNTKCFRTQAEAEASKCKDGKQPFVFAKQGVAWKDGSKNGPKGYQPEPGKPANPSKELGEVPIDSVLPNAGVAGVPFNYIAVCHVKGKDGKVHKVYTWMNYAKQYSGSEGRVSDYPYPGDDTYKVTMWCRTCPE